MVEPDRILLILREIRDDQRSIRADLHALKARADFEFSEIQDRLRRIDERIDGFFVRVERLEERT